MGPVCSNSQIKRKESKQIQTDQVVEQINNTNILNNINIVIELIYDIINDLDLEQKQEVYVEDVIKIQVHQDVEQQVENAVSEESLHSFLPSQIPRPSITLENEQEPYSQILQSMIVKKKEKLQVIQQDIQMIDYSPIKQESKSQSSQIIKSVEPFNLDFESSSSSEQFEWNQEYSIDSNGEILVTGIVN
ncbi:unnamed protein product (macronuclear) [Paramecium tetraurelia]|uniref:Uncharacterized protein n=1 Tax=Paramecium tetraurelia TaxID=5888 RepID=A0BQQ4_PARTE|nr:uncharacterized protein GSPATT00031100001 [Paramecium tetraurelia]CAK60871.1 unnamed protein product [Paramecium tetraurelia]|eukprot:XP_001428269.1 hypothetical protein (macronuclear) [Paramecium tetraurelia strain d4-2]